MLTFQAGTVRALSRALCGHCAGTGGHCAGTARALACNRAFLSHAQQQQQHLLRTACPTTVCGRHTRDASPSAQSASRVPAGGMVTSLSISGSCGGAILAGVPAIPSASSRPDGILCLATPAVIRASLTICPSIVLRPGGPCGRKGNFLEHLLFICGSAVLAGV